MTELNSSVFRFEGMEGRESEYSLIRAGETVTVEPTAFRVLIYLLRNAGRLVTKDEIIQAVWHDSAVSDNSLTRAVATLRRLLGDNSREPWLIATVQTIGYRFLVPVETISADGAQSLCSPATVVEEVEDGSHVSAASDSALAVEAVSAGGWDARAGRFRWKWLLAGCAATAVMLSGGIWYLRRPLPPRIAEYKQITHDGRSKELGGTDGTRLYFSYTSPISPSFIAQVGVNGGEIVPLPIAVPGTTERYLLDVSSDGSNALCQLPPSDSLWVVPLLGGPAKRVGDGEGAFSPDGTSVVYSPRSTTCELFVVRSDGTEPRKLTNVGPFAWGLRWSPDGRVIRFTQGGLLWQIASDGSGLHKILPDWHEQGQCCGNWTPDGHFYVFDLVSPAAGSQIWALDEAQRGLFRRNTLSAGPIDNRTHPLGCGHPEPGRKEDLCRG